MNRDGQKLSAEDSRLRSALAAYQARVDAGEVFDQAAFIAEHPDLAQPLREYFQKRGEASTYVPDPPQPEIAETRIGSQPVSDTSRGPSGISQARPVEIPKAFGRYNVIRALGQGAMGAVYLAQDTQLGRQVALKIPKFTEADSAEMLERFYREARAAATLRHPNICPVYDVGAIDGQHYISMAYIEGRPLRDFAKSSKRHSNRQIAVTIRKLALALEEAHSHDIVHRDLKPANIMIDRKSEPVVMDFGLARRLTSEGGQTTQSGIIVGTPAYMSPEQAQGDRQTIGPQVDIYSLGVILYELLTGQVPFQGNLMSILKQIAVDEPRHPSLLRSDIDSQLEAICLKMMAKQTAARYRSMSDVARDLGGWIRSASPNVRTGASQSAPDGRNPAPLSAASECGVNVSPGLPHRAAKQRRRFLIGAAGALAVLAAIIASSLPWLRPEANRDVGSSTADSVGPKPDVIAPRSDASESVATATPPKADGAPSPSVAGEGMDVRDYAVSFPTLQSCAAMPRLNLDSNGPLTVECWVRGFTGKTQEQIFLIMIGDLHLKLMHPGGQPAWTTFGGSPDNPAKSFRLVAPWPASPPPPVDTHLAFVRTDRQARLYVNGRLGDQKNKNGYVRSSVDQWSIGQGGNWDGSIDEVRISKIARYQADFTPSERLQADSDTLALYHFDEGRTTVLNDSSGHGGHGRLIRPKWVTRDGSAATRRVPPQEAAPVSPAEIRVSDRGLKFDGVDDYVAIPTLKIERTQPLTMEGYVTCDRAEGHFMQLAGLHGPGLEFVVTTFDDNLNAGMHLDGHGEFRMQADFVRPGKRFHFAATWDGEKTRLYWNGREAGGAYPDTRPNSRTPDFGCVIGNDALKDGDGIAPGRFAYLQGTIDAFRVTRGVRYEGNFVPARQLDLDDDTIAMYRFDEGSGDILTDASGNGHDGKIHGGPIWIVAPGRN